MPNDPTQHDQLRSPESKADVARNIGAAETVAEPTADPLSQTGWTVRVQGSDLVIVLTGDWIVRQTGVAANVARYLFQNETSRTLKFDATSLGHWDSALIVFLWDLQTEAARFEIEFDLSGLPEPARQLLALASVQVAPKAPPAAREQLLDWTGRRAIAYWSEVVEVAKLVGDTMLRAWPALRGRGGLRRVDVVDSAWEAGIAAVPIVTVVNVLVGGILAFVGAAQLRRFGAGIFVADLVGVAVVREMAPVMTAIIMSGRTGARMPRRSRQCKATRRSMPSRWPAFPCSTISFCRESPPSPA